MKATVEFRIDEKYAKEFLPDGLGIPLMGMVRKIRVPVDSKTYFRIGELTQLIRERDNRSLFYGWNIIRKYSTSEIDAAQLFLLKITKAFEPSGIQLGTIYDKRNVCPFCGVGEIQVSELILNKKSLPKGVDIARSLSEEIVVNRGISNLIHNEAITGCILKSILFETTESTNNENPSPEWFQLQIVDGVKIGLNNKTGIAPFEPDDKGEYRCPKGHVMGLNLLSELSIFRSSWDGSDIAVTDKYFGLRKGILRPFPKIIISKKFYNLLQQYKIKGYSIEVVKLE